MSKKAKITGDEARDILESPGMKPLLDFTFRAGFSKKVLVPRDNGKHFIRIQVSEDGRLWFNEKPIIFGAEV